MATLSEIFYLDSEGIKVPDLDTVHGFIVNAYKDIYGADVVLDADTQDGQWIGVISQAIYDTMNITALVYNSFSPSTALSDALDKNVRINGISRKSATYSMCDVKIVGTVGTEINNGSVKDTTDREWLLPPLVVIPLEGEITVTARAKDAGAWVSMPNTLTIINTPTRGWQSVTNINEGSVGAPIETDADLRRRQAKSVALPSQSVLSGMIGAVASLDGVTRYRAYENDTSEENSYGIPGHSTCMVVEGGDVQQIAEAILMHKTAGSGTYGDTRIQVADKFGILTYINFQRPTYNRIKLELTIKPLEGYTNVFVQQIKDRIIDYINNLGIGENIYVARLLPPILACNTQNTDRFDILEIKLGKEGDAELLTKNVILGFDGAALITNELITIIEQADDGGAGDGLPDSGDGNTDSDSGAGDSETAGGSDDTSGAGVSDAGAAGSANSSAEVYVNGN